jgi:polyhydroxyalkanoate synthesis regulator phasin
MAKKQVNFKLPPDLIEALDVRAGQENTNRTELVIQGIRYILGLSEPQNISVDNRIDHRIEEIENRLQQIEAQHADSRAGNAQIDQLEKRISQLEAQSIDSDTHQQLRRLAEQIEDLRKTFRSTKRSASKTKERQISKSQAIGLDDIPDPLTLTELAGRLGVDRSNLAKARKSKTAAEFEDYTRKRDPESFGWHFEEDREIFIPSFPDS